VIFTSDAACKDCRFRKGTCISERQEGFLAGVPSDATPTSISSDMAARYQPVRKVQPSKTDQLSPHARDDIPWMSLKDSPALFKRLRIPLMCCK